MIEKRKWFPAGKAKSEEEIHERYNVYKNSSHNNCSKFFCRRNRWYHCQFMIRWDEQSGQLWESGEHNHESTAYKYRKTREWQFVAKVSCFKQIRCQYTVQKSGVSSPTCNKFRCNFFRKQQKCLYAMRWNSETGELFESGQHSKHPAPRTKIMYKWHLLETMRQNSVAEIRRRYTVKDTSRGQTGSVRCVRFKCDRCDGQKCDFRLRWDYKSTEIHWNKEQQCQRRKSSAYQEIAYDSKFVEEEDGLESEENSQSQTEHQQVGRQNKGETKMPSMPVVFLEEIRRADYKCRPPPLKREAIAEKEQQQPADPFTSSLPFLTIDEEETSISHWHPNSLRRVKKEEAPTEEGLQKEVAKNGNAENEAPTKMLLRERKRPPNYAGLDGNGKKEIRSGRAKK